MTGALQQKCDSPLASASRPVKERGGGWRRIATPYDHHWLPLRLAGTLFEGTPGRERWIGRRTRGISLVSARPCPVRDCRRARFPLGRRRLIPSRDAGCKGACIDGEDRISPSGPCGATRRVRFEPSVRRWAQAQLRGQAQVAVVGRFRADDRGMCRRRDYPANRRKHRG